MGASARQRVSASRAARCLGLTLLLAMSLLPLASRAVEVGERAPDFIVPILADPAARQADATRPDSGRLPVLRLADLRGRVVYVDFWQSSCLPCREGLRSLGALSREFGDQLVVVAISTDTDPRAVLAFIEQTPLDVAIASDPSAAVARRYGVRGVPTAYLIARDGTVRNVLESTTGQDVDTVRGRIRAALDGVGDGPADAVAR